MKRDVLLNQGIALYFYFFIGYRLAVGSLVLTPLTLTALFHTEKSQIVYPKAVGLSSVAMVLTAHSVQAKLAYQIALKR